MFVAVADMMLRKGFTMAKAAKKYDKWKAGQVRSLGKPLQASQIPNFMHLLTSTDPSPQLAKASYRLRTDKQLSLAYAMFFSYQSIL